MFKKSKGILMREPGQDPSSSGMPHGAKVLLCVVGGLVLVSGIVFALVHFFHQHKLALQGNEALLARLRDDFDPELFQFHPANEGVTLVAEDGKGKRVRVYIRSIAGVCAVYRNDDQEFTTVKFSGNVVMAGSDGGDSVYFAADKADILVPAEATERHDWFSRQLAVMTIQRIFFKNLEAKT